MDDESTVMMVLDQKTKALRPPSAAELVELACTFAIGNAIGQLRHVGVTDERIRERFERAMSVPEPTPPKEPVQ